LDRQRNDAGNLRAGRLQSAFVPGSVIPKATGGPRAVYWEASHCGATDFDSPSDQALCLFGSAIVQKFANMPASKVARHVQVSIDLALVFKRTQGANGHYAASELLRIR
jgi:hypothetical protein